MNLHKSCAYCANLKWVKEKFKCSKLKIELENAGACFIAKTVGEDYVVIEDCPGFNENIKIKNNENATNFIE